MYLSARPLSLWKIFKRGAILYGKAILLMLPFSILLGLLHGVMWYFFDNNSLWFGSFNLLWQAVFWAVCFLIIYGFMVITTSTLVVQVNNKLNGFSGFYKEPLWQAFCKWPIYFPAMIMAFILIHIGLALIVLPGIYLMVIFLFIKYGILLDNKKTWESMKYSAKLVWGNWWRTFCVSFLYLIIIIGLKYLICFIGCFHNRIFITHYVVTALLTMIIGPLIITTLLILYRDLQLRYRLKNEANK